jgi:hypothetical protein
VGKSRSALTSDLSMAKLFKSHNSCLGQHCFDKRKNAFVSCKRILCVQNMHVLDVLFIPLILYVKVGLFSGTYQSNAKACKSGMRVAEKGTIAWNAGVCVRSTAVARWVATMFSGSDRDTCWNTHIQSRGFSCSRSHQK